MNHWRQKCEKECKHIYKFYMRRFLYVINYKRGAGANLWGFRPPSGNYGQ